jgi:hypothetical protein
MIKSSLVRRCVALACTALAFGLAAGSAGAADHIDLPRSVTGNTLARPDASITDFFAFVSGRNLVLILDVNPNLDPAVQTYRFPTDVSYRINLDTDSPVTIGTDVVSREFGGVIPQPGLISEDVVFEVKFDSRNRPQLSVTGANRSRCDSIRPRVRMFTGLRAEAFIFAPAVRNNVGSIVLEVPLSAVIENQKKLLLWATTTVDTPAGQFVELGARALRSQFPPNAGLNALHPSQHGAAGLGRPDVMILDVTKPTSFPNGRHPSDDVVDEVATFTLLPTDRNAATGEIAQCAVGGPAFPCPVPPSATADDIRLLGRFPYLGRPYTPSERTASSSSID